MQQALAAPANNAHKVASEAFQLVVQQVAAAQALEAPATDCLHTLTAQIDVERDMRHKATDVMAGDLAVHHREEVRQLLIATTVGAMALVTAVSACQLGLTRRCRRGAALRPSRKNLMRDRLQTANGTSCRARAATPSPTRPADATPNASVSAEP